MCKRRPRCINILPGVTVSDKARNEAIFYLILKQTVGNNYYNPLSSFCIAIWEKYLVDKKQSRRPVVDVLILL